MVAAKLDQTTVLETKFRQNRFTMKGRSAGQRHTDRQANVGKNKGPSGLQSGQQTPLKTSTPLRYASPVAKKYTRPLRCRFPGDHVGNFAFSFAAFGLPSGASVERRRFVVDAASFPLGSSGTSQGEAATEVVADDVARVVARIPVVTRVLALTEARYTHAHNRSASHKVKAKFHYAS